MRYDTTQACLPGLACPPSVRFGDLLRLRAPRAPRFRCAHWMDGAADCRFRGPRAPLWASVCVAHACASSSPSCTAGACLCCARAFRIGSCVCFYATRVLVGTSGPVRATDHLHAVAVVCLPTLTVEAGGRLQGRRATHALLAGDAALGGAMPICRHPGSPNPEPPASAPARPVVTSGRRRL